MPLPLPSQDPSVLAQSLLPSSIDNVTITNNFAIHVSRILTTNMPFFENLQDAVLRHIPHKFSTEMAQKSVVVRNT